MTGSASDGPGRGSQSGRVHRCLPRPPTSPKVSTWQPAPTPLLGVPARPPCTMSCHCGRVQQSVMSGHQIAAHCPVPTATAESAPRSTAHYPMSTACWSCNPRSHHSHSATPLHIVHPSPPACTESSQPVSDHAFLLAPISYGTPPCPNALTLTEAYQALLRTPRGRRRPHQLRSGDGPPAMRCVPALHSTPSPRPLAVAEATATAMALVSASSQSPPASRLRPH